MWSAELALVCALSALGRAPSTFPPIEFVHTRPPGVSPNAEGFVRAGEHRIYLITSSPVFRAVRESDLKCGNYQAVRKLASVLVHEEWHLNHPGNEEGAYIAQLTALGAMGIGYTHPVFVAVRRSMLQVLASQRPERVQLARHDP